VVPHSVAEMTPAKIALFSRILSRPGAIKSS
jgi:hypothetical protein